MKTASLKTNIIMNAIRTCMMVIFPIITFPYITRILSPEGLGKINFANSINSYFMLLAGLGIVAYAIRQGSQYRDNKKTFNKFANQVFSINVISSIFAYVLLFTLLFWVKAFNSYRLLILIYSISIVFNTIGVEWVYSIYEDYIYITVRSFIFQLISVVLMFLFVKSPRDIYFYTCITVLSSAGSNILDFFNAKKYCRFRLVLNRNLLKHLKPILIIFSITLATTIYVSSDTTMLGLINGDKEVGYYSVATKLYQVLKSIINSVVTVYSARLSYLFVNDKVKYKRYFNDAFRLIVLFAVPVATGGLIVSPQIIIVLSGSQYLSASKAMSIILISILFASFGNLISIGALLPMCKEKVMFFATTFGACFNIASNCILLPRYGNTGAAISTFLTEFFICIILFVSFRKNYIIALDFRHVFFCIVATIPFFIIKKLVFCINCNVYIQLFLTMVICGVTYFSLLLLFRDRMMVNLVNEAKIKLKV